MRVSLLGGGTDLPEWYENHTGRVLGSTIDKYVYVILSKRFDKKIVVGYSKQETVDSVDEINHDLVREAAKYAGMRDGFEVKTLSDVPSGGSGLGSSSAILVGLLKAFCEYQNISISNLEIAKETFRIEREVLGKSVGKQDHWFAALGGRNIFFFDNIDVRQMEPHTLSEDGLYLFFTGITRKANDILLKQSMNINEKLYTELAELPLRYINPGNNLPYLLKWNWEIKKQLADNITNSTIEQMCQKAKEGGAEACKILGAGGGGFLLVSLPYLPETSQIWKLKRTMQDYRELPFKFVNHGTRIIFNND